jgi:heptosyltransferase-2
MPAKIVIRAPNHLGDCVMALPAIDHAREAHPGGEVHLLVSVPLAELFARNPSVDNLIAVPSEHLHGWLSVFKIRDLLAPHHFDIGYILPPSFGAASGFKLAGVRERIGYVTDGRRLLLTRPLPIPVPANSVHRSESFFNLLRRGSGIDLDFVRPKLFLSDDDLAKAAPLLEPFGIGPQDTYAAVSHRAVAESRRWGLDNYTELIKRIVSSHGIKIVLIGTEDDRRSGDEVVARTGPGQVANLCGRTGIRQLAAVLARARLFIGNDSGPAHLAAAVGTELVVLSGADDPAETSPLTPHKRLVYRSNLNCISCVKNKCPLQGPDYMRCMREITVDTVAAEVNSLLTQNP